MLKLTIAATLAAALGGAMTIAQPRASEPDPKRKGDVKSAAKIEAKVDDAMFELRMTDESVLRVILLDPAVELITKYGKLVIPAAEIRRLEFGFRYPEGVDATIDKAVAELGSPEFQTREDAQKELVKIGHYSIPKLRRATKSEDPEVVLRAHDALKRLEGALEQGQPELRDHDVAETAEFTAKGRIQINVLRVRTKHFGETTVKLTDIRSFRSIGRAINGDVSIDAAKYAKTNQSEWMETSIEVIAGQQLDVTSSGRVDQWPQGPGQYMVGPEGLADAKVPGNNSVGLPGQLIGRIGAKGRPFPIGAAYKGKANETGKLYLRIEASPWNCASTGSYKVVVNITNP